MDGYTSDMISLAGLETTRLIIRTNLADVFLQLERDWTAWFTARAGHPTVSGLTQESLDLFDQFILVHDRLGLVLIESQGQVFIPVARHGVGRESNHRQAL